MFPCFGVLIPTLAFTKGFVHYYFCFFFIFFFTHHLSPRNRARAFTGIRNLKPQNSRYKVAHGSIARNNNSPPPATNVSPSHGHCGLSAERRRPFCSVTDNHYHRKSSTSINHYLQSQYQDTHSLVVIFQENTTFITTSGVKGNIHDALETLGACSGPTPRHIFLVCRCPRAGLEVQSHCRLFTRTLHHTSTHRVLFIFLINSSSKGIRQ